MERERKKNESTLVDEDGSLREMGLLEGGGWGDSITSCEANGIVGA